MRCKKMGTVSSLKGYVVEIQFASSPSECSSIIGWKFWVKDSCQIIEYAEGACHAGACSGLHVWTRKYINQS